MAKSSSKPVFKIYAQHQMMLLPPSLEELIPSSHPVRIVNEVLEQIDITTLLQKYIGGGSSSYHPKVLLKVLVYGYISNIYSSRKLEEACAQNIHYMWLSGMQTPDHNTINRFRSERLKGVVRHVFTQVVQLLAAEGLLTLKGVIYRWHQDRSQCQPLHLCMGQCYKNQQRENGKAVGRTLGLCTKGCWRRSRDAGATRVYPNR
jgi:transposase